MGYVQGIGICRVGCGKVFGFNPNRVPSIRIENGEREPVCEDCVRRVNAMRKEAGAEPFFTVLPGAYEQAKEEEIF